MGYELRQRLPGPHDSWIAVDRASAREVLAHRMGDPASADLMPLVMQVLLGKNEAARASVLDFVEQEGGWLLVTVDSPGCREIRSWLQGCAERQATTATPAVDPLTLTRMFRAADSRPSPQAGDAIGVFTPPPEPGPDKTAEAPAGREGEFTRFFSADPGERQKPAASPDDLERTKVYAANESAAEIAPPLQDGRGEEVTQKFATEQPTPPPAAAAGDFTRYFASDPGAPVPAAAPQPDAGDVTHYFGGDREDSVPPQPPPGEEITQQFATANPAAPSKSQAGEFTQYFAGDPGGPPQPPQAASQTKKGEFTRMFAAGAGGQSETAAPKHQPPPAPSGDFTRMFNSAAPAVERQAPDPSAGLTAIFGEGGSSQPPPPPPPSGQGATGIFESPSAQRAAPPAGAVASDFTRMLKAPAVEPAPEAKAPADATTTAKLPGRISPMLLLFGVVVVLAIALVLGVVLLK